MADWTNIPDANVEVGAPTRSIDGLALRDNPIALAEGAAGAPKVQTAALEQTGGSEAVTQACMRAAAVGQGELKTATGVVSSTAQAGAVLATLPGGEYGFYPRIRVAITGNDLTSFTIGGKDTFTRTQVGTTYLSRIAFDAVLTAHDRLATQRYVTSSRPYASYRDNDPVPLFMFATIHKATKEAHMVYVAPDPPWANNGPTIINPLGRLNALAGGLLTVSLAQAATDPAKHTQREQELADLFDFLQTSRDLPSIQAELRRTFTQEEKNADMVLIPHPFTGNDLSDYQVVVINPTDSVFCRALAARHDYLGENVAAIISGGDLIIDNDPMPGLQTPPDVIAVRARWKLTP